MKRNVILSSTAWWAFWVEIPLIALLAWAMSVNIHAEGTLKLYPLIIVLIGAIIFTAVFLLRLVEVSYSEIKAIGRFSSRDSAIINEGKRLNLKLLDGGKVRIILFGRDEMPGFDWLKPEEGDGGELPLFRGKVYGGKRAIKSVLKYFGVGREDIDAIFVGKSSEIVYDALTVVTTRPEDGIEINIIFEKTIDGIKECA